jgi:DNA-binding protein Fis
MTAKNKTIVKLEITNPKIIDFYDKTKLDFESMNLLIIEIYDKMSNELTGTFDKNMKNDILLNIKTEKNYNEQFRKDVISTLNNSVEIYKNEVSTIKNFNTILTNEVIGLRDIIMKSNNDLTNSIIAKLFEIKQSYVDEMKNIILSKDSSNILKLMEMIEKENTLLIDKTLKTVNEIIPKNNNQNNNYIESLINNFKLELNNNIQTIKDNDTHFNLDDVSKIIDTKYNNLLSNIQQTMLMNINCSEERVTKNILELKEFELIKQNDQDKLNNDLLLYLNKFKNSTTKGSQSEMKLNNILQELYPSAEIIDTSNDTKKCDIMIKRNNKPIILLENKSYQNPVSKDEILKFSRDIEFQNYSAIMISQTSNISTKENFQIDIINNNIVLYICNCNYDKDKIKLAISIIDHLYPMINENTNKNITTIDNDIMLLINEEYKKFLNQRDAIKNYIHDTNKKLISNLYDMELPNLNNILLSKFTLTQDTNLTCLICKKFVGINKKSLSKHKQTCAKNNNHIVSDEESTTNDETMAQPIDEPIEKPTKQLTKNKK